MELEKDLQNIINYSHGFAEKMLHENKEFYPFAVAIDNTGALMPIGYKDEGTDMPKSQQVIEELTNILQLELDKNKIRAFGLTYDVRVSINEFGDKSDAILIDIQHILSKNLPRYYFTYSWSDNDQLLFGESFGMKR